MNKESGIDVTNIAGPSHEDATSSDTGTDSSSTNSFISPAAKKAWKQPFRKVWLQDPQFASWLAETENPYKVHCIVCSKMLTPSKHKLQAHASTKIHQTNMEQKEAGVISGPSHEDATNSDTGTDSSSTNSFTCPAAKKSRQQLFRKVWLQDPQFASWLAETEDPCKVACTVCSKVLTASKHKLDIHATTKIHQTNMEQKEAGVISAPSDEAATSSGTATGKKGKTVWRQTFCNSWLEDPELKLWLQETENPYKGRCAACYKIVPACKSQLQMHGRSLKHLMNMNHRTEPLHKDRSFADSVKEFELKVCLDIIEHNRSFHSFKHYTKLMQSAMKHVSVVQHLTLQPVKISAIIRNVINKAVVLETIDRLKGKSFSILVDETTDISDTKLLCFLIRYVHEEKIHTYLLDLIGITECTAENVHKCLLNSLSKYNLLASNIVGLSVDNASVMVGANNSLFSRLQKDNNEICLFRCICHSMHLAARHACDKLPPHIEKFLHKIYSYFSRSPKRQSILEDTQVFMKYPKLKMIQPSQTRWLALFQCVQRVLDQWLPLFSVIAEAASGGSEAAVKLFDTFQCPYTKAYIQFLQHLLPTFNTINKYFQDSKVVIHHLLPQCYKLLKVLGTNFIKPEYIQGPNLHKIDVYNDENLLPLQSIYHGSDSMASVLEIENKSDADSQKLQKFYNNIQKCYQTAFQNIVQRVPFDEPFLNSLKFLDPHTALDDTRNNEQLDSVLNKFQSLFKSGLVKDEWHKMPSYFSDEEKKTLLEKSIPSFWCDIRGTKNDVDEYIFPNLSKVADLCLTLPHSNADVERYFSTITNIKTKRRNKLTPQTIAALTRVQLDLKNKNATCYNYEITNSMINLFNSNMYTVERVPKELTGILLPIGTDEPTDTENNFSQETGDSGAESTDN